MTMETKLLAIIIEDDEYLGDIFSDTLQGIGMETRVFRDGENAMLQLARVTPALVILDLNLPKYSGANILEYLRDEARLKETWVIIATADAVQAAELNRHTSLKHNLLTLIKPISVDQLEQSAQKAIQASRS